MAQGPSPSALTQRLEVQVASGDTLDIRHFHAAERMSSLFEISLVALSENADIDFEAVVGQPMTFGLRIGSLPRQERTWTGVCSQLQQVAVEDQGLSTYQLTLVPTLWFLTQRRNHRMFQLKSELDIVLLLLSEWGITPVQRLSGTYKKRKYRVQYAESDYTFICRMLEDVGISFYFETEAGETKLVLHDAPQANTLREPAIAYRDHPNDADLEHITEVRVGRKIRPGKLTLRDHDYRQPPSYKLMGSAAGTGTAGIEDKLEAFHYTPGAFLFEADKGDATPNADDKGKYRTDESEANALATKRLDAKRAMAKTVSFDTNTVDPAPGVILSFLDHPKSDLGAGKRFLILSAAMSGKHDAKWVTTCEAVSAEPAYRPAMSTAKPKVVGVESATVVGPAGEEIHTDEFGRVRVHFHWDRESKMDDNSSCWIHTSQPWGGTGFGGTALPRIGQEVIVDFLGGDPDRPIVVGRVYTNLQKTPYKLPDNKTQSGLKSNSTGGGGGYNEMMFEDAVGKELLRMQAEKDLNKLVKNDEQVKIGRDRSKQIGRDDKHDVGRDRARTVGNNETVKIGKNRSKQVGETEDISIGKDLIKQVAQNEREMTGLSRSIVVGVNRATQVGAIDSTLVGDTHTVSIAPPGEGGGPTTYTLMRKDKIQLKTAGGASITLEGDKITLDAKRIEIKAGGKGILMEATGGHTIIKGAPKVKLNP